MSPAGKKQKAKPKKASAARPPRSSGRKRKSVVRDAEVVTIEESSNDDMSLVISEDDAYTQPRKGDKDRPADDSEDETSSEDDDDDEEAEDGEDKQTQSKPLTEERRAELLKISKQLAATKRGTLNPPKKGKLPRPCPEEFFVLRGQSEDKMNQWNWTCSKCPSGALGAMQSQNATSRNNLERHYKRFNGRNGHSYEDFTAACAKLDTEARLKKAGKDERAKLTTGKIQLTIEEAFAREGKWKQDTLNQHVLEMIVVGNVSLNQAASDEFGSVIIRGLGPKVNGLKWPSRRTLSCLIKDKFEEKKEALMALMRKVDFVSTTADAWTSWNAGFLGSTVHWFDEDLNRKSACLGLRRIVGRHNAEKLAKELKKLNAEFGIAEKIAGTTTDNGKNFCKSFRVFGEGMQDSSRNAEEQPQLRTEESELPDQDYAPLPEDTDDTPEREPIVVGQPIKPVDMTKRGEGWVASDQLPKGLRQVQLQQLLEDEVNSYATPSVATAVKEIGLPKHQRCAAHTLNLVATDDAARALIDDINYGELFERVINKKLRPLWVKQSRSTLISDDVKETFAKLFKTDVKTRWNSTYDAMCDMLKLGEEQRELLNDLMIRAKIGRGEFLKADWEFMWEYVEVMRPIAEALDIMQGEGLGGEDKLLGLGYLVPTIGALISTYTDFLEEEGPLNLRYCKALAKAILDGLKKRYSFIFEDDDLLVAAAVHPKFRLKPLIHCLPRGRHEAVIQAVQDRVRALFEKSNPPPVGSQPDGTPSPAVPERDAIQVDDSRKRKSTTTLYNVYNKKTRDFDPNEAYAALHPKGHLLMKRIEDYLRADDGEEGPEAFHGMELLKELFINTNTVLPSSAPVERLFSLAGHIFIPCRSRLKDANLEALVFLHANYKVLGL